MFYFIGVLFHWNAKEYSKNNYLFIHYALEDSFRLKEDSTIMKYIE